MAPSLLRHSGWVALVAACGASVACSTTPSQPPDTFVSASVGPSGAAPGLCTFSSGTSEPWLSIGTATSGKPVTVETGGSNGSGTVTVDCTVHPVGQGFDIALTASEDGPQGGSITITSPSGQGKVTSSGSMDVSATFGGEKGHFSQSNCTITYVYQMGPVPLSPPVAAGRIWGHLSCPMAQALGQMATTADGGVFTETCDGEADFLFEQCGQ